VGETSAETPKTKLQKPKKLQDPNTKCAANRGAALSASDDPRSFIALRPELPTPHRRSTIGDGSRAGRVAWNFFGFWSLVFGIYSPWAHLHPSAFFRTIPRLTGVAPLTIFHGSFEVHVPFVHQINYLW
jgi:hypothetical protein